MSEPQTTLKRSASLKGQALHTGNEAELTLCPAPENSGFTFKRIDLPDEPTIEVRPENVRQVERATTIGEGNIKVHTVEHVLSALRGMGVDNCLITMDSNEPPIGDGSARAYVELIQEAGIAEQSARRQYYELKDPVYVHGPDGASVIAVPSKDFEISCTNVTHTGDHTQFRHYIDSPEAYRTEIGSARTFVFYEEVQPLMDKGLIKGGSLDNAIVIRGQSVLTKEPLRFPDEFVRHKILDIIGDLALFPKRLKARIVATRTGHALNAQFTKALLKQFRERESLRFPVEFIPSGEGALDIDEVMRVLPHRFPFLFIDRVIQFEGDTKVVASKNVSMNEPFFPGHFPAHPIMPGVLQLEAMAQAASILLLRQAGNAGKLGFFMSADKVKFRKPVRPGDTLIIQCELTRSRGQIGRASACCLVKNEIVSEADLTFAIQEA